MQKKCGKHGKSPSKGSGKNRNIVSMFKQQSIKQQIRNRDIAGGETTIMKQDQSSDLDKANDKLHHSSGAGDMTEISSSSHSIHKNKSSSLTRKRKLETSNSDNPHLKRQPTEEPSTSTDSLNLSQKENSNMPTSSHTEELGASSTSQVQGKRRLSLKHRRNMNHEKLSANTASKTEMGEAETSNSTEMPNRKRTKLSTETQDRANTEVGTETPAGDSTKGRVEEVESNASSHKTKSDGGNKSRSRDRTEQNDDDNEQEEVDNDTADNVIIHEDGTVEYRVPYYLENFLLVLNSVTKDEFFCDLFNEDDDVAIKSYLALSGKKVYYIHCQYSST